MVQKLEWDQAVCTVVLRHCGSSMFSVYIHNHLQVTFTVKVKVIHKMTTQFHELLADRTNGRAIATLLRLSSSCVTLCIVAKRCVLEQKLLWRAYRKSYMRNRLVPK